MDGLEGRSAIVTGGSTLIGRAVVRELHGHGMSRRDRRHRRRARRGARGRARRAGALPPHRHHRRRRDRGARRGGRRALRPPRRSRQPRLHLPRRRLRVLARRLARGARRQRRQRGRDGAGRASAPEGERPRRDRQLRLHLRERRPDGPLALPGQQGRARAADPQHGDGPRTRRHPRQRRLPGLDLVEGDGRADAATTARRPTGSPRRSTCSAASAIRRRWRGSSRSSSPTTRASSPARPGRSTAATPRWGPRARSRPFPS